MSFMADDVSVILGSHGFKQKSAWCVGGDRNKVLEGLCKSGERRKRKPIRKDPMKIRRGYKKECKKGW